MGERMAWDDLKWDAAGLVTVVVQDRHTGELRMVGHADREALQATLDSGEAHFFSRSRGQLWRKGETSGHTLSVAELWIDCDGDAVLYLAEPKGPTCHTGKPACFYRRWPDQAEGRVQSSLFRLWQTLESRRQATGTTSYTRRLLDGGAPRIGAKLREEADELAVALASEAPERVVSEAADVLYHLMVGLLHRDMRLEDVARELDRRFGVSGLEEKAARSQT